jgi:hypothetical protein
VSFAAVNYFSPYADLAVDETDGAPQPNVVDGLENGVTYFFRSAMLDEAGNISFITDDNNINGLQNCAGAIDFDCDMMATPLPVYGLLTEDLNCFISTAAFGSSMSEEVQVFREFRNRFMIDSVRGQKLIQAYYNYGSKLSLKIYKSKFRRALARTALQPPLWFAKSSLKFGLFYTSIAFSIGLFGFIALIGFSFNWGRKKCRS